SIVMKIFTLLVGSAPDVAASPYMNSVLDNNKTRASMSTHLLEFDPSCSHSPTPHSQSSRNIQPVFIIHNSSFIIHPLPPSTNSHFRVAPSRTRVAFFPLEAFRVPRLPAPAHHRFSLGLHGHPRKAHHPARRRDGLL